MSVGPTCPDCGWVHPSNAAHAVGLFQPDGPSGYRANAPDAPLRSLRAEAEADWCKHKQRRNRERASFVALLDAEGDDLDQADMTRARLALMVPPPR